MFRSLISTRTDSAADFPVNQYQWFRLTYSHRPDYSDGQVMNKPTAQNSIPSQAADECLSREETSPLDDKSIIFFDGVCGLCNRFVDSLLKHDTQNLFLFAPLQGETAQRRLSKNDTETLGSIVLWEQGRTFRRSTAVVRVLWKLGRVWACLGWGLWIVPKPLRDLGYKLVAVNRYRLFGKKETCRLPTPDELSRFLP
jgi:predicted DCC family thiol-disulfide oxidoreductase YuxK